MSPTEQETRERAFTTPDPFRRPSLGVGDLACGDERLMTDGDLDKLHS